jgi:hypothetical protein
LLQEAVVFKRLSGLVVALMLVAGNGVVAEVVKNLHSARLPIENQSSSALASASQDALAEVLVKVSGSEDILGHPDVVAVLPNARDHVQQYVFLRDTGPDKALYARFEFEASFVNGLLTKARLPLWTANRPRVLVWMVADLDGRRQFVSLADTPDLAAQLVTEFERRGLPVQLPLFDLSDTTSIAVEDVWEQRGPIIQAASNRYDIQDILVGRGVVISSGTWTGDWSYLYGKHRLDRSSSAPLAAGFLQDGVALAAEEMASRYAVAATGVVDDRVQMTVSGVYEFSDYTAIVSWVESLELIEHANIESIRGDSVVFGLDAAADADQLISIIELNDRLQPVESLPGELVYQWRN